MYKLRTGLTNQKLSLPGHLLVKLESPGPELGNAVCAGMAKIEVSKICHSQILQNISKLVKFLLGSDS